VKTQLVELPSYLSDLEEILDFLDKQDKDGAALFWFADELEAVLEFIKTNPTKPGVHPVTGDQSWPFGKGHYRIFFKCTQAPEATRLYLIHVIDNRRANLRVYPSNRLPTHDADD
jgi:hypothetical protein